MAKGRWETFHGLKAGRWEDRDPARPALPEGCNVIVTRPVLLSAGATNPTLTRRALERDGWFHHHIVVLPDGSWMKATRDSSLEWIVKTQRAGGIARSKSNLLVGRQPSFFGHRAHLETAVAPEGPWAPPWEPEIFHVPLLAERTSESPATPLPRTYRELLTDADVEDALCDEVLKVLATAAGGLDRTAIADALHLTGEDGHVLSMVLRRLIAGGEVVREGTRYRLAALPRTLPIQADLGRSDSI